MLRMTLIPGQMSRPRAWTRGSASVGAVLRGLAEARTPAGLELKTGTYTFVCSRVPEGRHPGLELGTRGGELN